MEKTGLKQKMLEDDNGNFEMWLWRKLVKIIKWADKVSDRKVLMKVGKCQKVAEIIKSRKKKWLGHISRHEGFEKDVIEGMETP